MVDSWRRGTPVADSVHRMEEPVLQHFTGQFAHVFRAETGKGDRHNVGVHSVSSAESLQHAGKIPAKIGAQVTTFLNEQCRHIQFGNFGSDL